MQIEAHRVILAAASAAFVLPLLLSLLTLPTMGITRITPKLSDSRWTELDNKLANKIGPLHHLLGSGDLPSDVAIDQLGAILTEFLRSEPEFEDVQKEFFNSKQATSLEEARIMKRELRKKANKKNSTAEDKSNWLRAVKLHSFLLKISKEKEGKGGNQETGESLQEEFLQVCQGRL